jgi:N-acetylneuraminate synthase/N,N'-diacetyllegionaminate synthase
MPAFKISSGDITHMPLIQAVAETGKPVLLSTGMSTLDEVASAVRWCRDAGNEEVVLLHCSCLYPPPDDEVNLNAMVTMQESFAVPVGYSDHTEGIAVPFAAVSMGARVIEKHFTLDRNMAGPDHRLSLDPDGFACMVDGIRKIERARGGYRKEPSPGEATGLVDGRRSIMAATDIPAGTVLTREMLKVLKPAKGLPPSSIESVVGRVAGRRIARNEPLTNEMLQETEELWEQAVFARG